MIKKVENLLLQDKLTRIREENIDRIRFREGIRDIGEFISYYFADSLKYEMVDVKTPLGIARGPRIKEFEDIIVVSVLRAAIPLVEGIMGVFKEAQYGVIGAWRAHKSPFPVKVGYIRLPEIEDKIVIVGDPLLATGNTMKAILDHIKKQGKPRRLVIFNIITSKKGLKKVLKYHPDIEFYTASIEEDISPDGYVIPGLGDAGDIAFGKPKSSR